MADGISHHTCICQSLSVWQENFYGKLVAVGVGEESNLQRRHNERRQQDDGNAAPDGEPGVLECPVKHMVIGVLHPVSDGVSTSGHLVGLNDVYLQERNDRYGQYERHHEVDGNGDGEVLETVVEHALHGDEEGEEDGTDADGGQHHRHEVLPGRFDGRLFRLVALS